MPNYRYGPTRKENLKFWTEQLRAFHLAGLTQKEFCQRNNLVYSSFRYWKRRIDHQTAADQIEFVEVDARICSPSSVALTLSAERFDILIHNGADPDMVLWILRELNR